MRNSLMLAGLVASASASPGPNNLIIAAIAARQSVTRAVPSMIAITLAGTLMVGAAATILGGAPDPMLVRGAEFAGCAIMVALALSAWRSAGSSGLTDARVIGPGALFALQIANPKALLLTVTVAAAARALPVAMGVTLMLTASICFVSLALWAVIGAGAGNFLRTPRSLKLFDRALGLLLIASAAALLAQGLEI